MSPAIRAAAHDPVQLHQALDRLPAGAYTCDAEGLITYFNRHAEHLWGRAPRLNDPVDRFCGSFRLFTPDDEPIAHDDCWMARALRDGREYHGCEIVVERPDRSRLTVLAYATPVHDNDGNVVAAVNMLVNISERTRMERLLREASRDNDLYRATVATVLREELAPLDAGLADMAAGGVRGDVAGHASELREQLARVVLLIDELVDRPRAGPP